MPAPRQQTILQGSPADVVAGLARAAAEDSASEQQAKAFGKKGGLCWAGCGVLGFLSFFAIAIFWPLALLTIGGAIAFMIPAIINSKKASELKAKDLDNDRITLAYQLVQELTPDLSAKNPIELTVRHGDMFTYGKQLSRQKLAGGMMTFDVWQFAYEDEWFSLAGRMQDGGALRMGITSSAKRKSKQKRKYTKLADRIEDEITVSLRVPTERYPNLDSLPSLLQPGVLDANAGLSVKRVQVQAPIIRISAETRPLVQVTGRYGKSFQNAENKVNGDRLIGLLAFIYGGLGACRAPEPGKAGKGATPAVAGSSSEFAGLGQPTAPPASAPATPGMSEFQIGG